MLTRKVCFSAICIRSNPDSGSCSHTKVTADLVLTLRQDSNCPCRFAGQSGHGRQRSAELTIANIYTNLGCVATTSAFKTAQQAVRWRRSSRQRFTPVSSSPGPGRGAGIIKTVALDPGISEPVCGAHDSPALRFASARAATNLPSPPISVTGTRFSFQSCSADRSSDCGTACCRISRRYESLSCRHGHTCQTSQSATEAKTNSHSQPTPG